MKHHLDRILARVRVPENHTTVRPHADFQQRPIEWIVKHLNVQPETLDWSLNPGYENHEWDGTPDPLRAILKGLADGKNIAVEAGTGTGKTFLAACIVLWFLACFEDAIVVTSAPKKDQLRLHLWKEIRRLWPKFKEHFPDAELLKEQIRMRSGDETWAATAFVAGVGAAEEIATRAQGWHAEHLLIITEETPGISSAIMEAFENTRTAPHNLQLSLGNPNHREDTLHQFARQTDVTAIRISALDFPNVVCDDPSIVPGAVSLRAVERRKQKYQSTPTLYESRVRGISPKKAFGVALRYDEHRHLETLSDRDLKHGIRDQGWLVYAAVDTGDWRTALVIGMVDRSGRIHIVREAFWHRVSSEEIAQGIDHHLRDLGASGRATVVADRRSAHTVRELNLHLKRLGSPYRVLSVAQEAKMREASVHRLNDLLDGDRLLFRRSLGVGLRWRQGLSTSNQGEVRTGSRLLWEICEWRYPEPRDGQAQRQDPDDDTADGADAIAALRYLVMTQRRSPKLPKPAKPPADPNVDTGLERIMADRQRLQKKYGARMANRIWEEGRFRRRGR